MEFKLWYIIPIFAIILNFIATFIIVKRDDLDSFQKCGQIILAWLIPYFASIGLLLFHRSNDSSGYQSNQVGNYGKDDKAYSGGNHNGDL